MLFPPLGDLFITIIVLFNHRVGELSVGDVLIASVGVQEYGEKLNEDLRERFSVKAEDYPVFKLFKKGAHFNPPVHETTSLRCLFIRFLSFAPRLEKTHQL